MASSPKFKRDDGAVPTADPETFYGWNEQGGVIKSAIPVDNACTRAHKWLASEAKGKCVSPSELAEIIELQPEWVRSMFPERVRWQGLAWFWQWPCATACTSAEQALKLSVCGVALTDENAWSRVCETAERRSGSPCRFDAVGERVMAFGIRLVPPDFSEACRAHIAPPVGAGGSEPDSARQADFF